MATTETMSFQCDGMIPKRPWTLPVYLAEKPDPTLIPYDWYLALVVAGAREHRFDRRRMRQLLAFKCQPHVNRPRGGKPDALKLLQAEGVDDDLAVYFGTQIDLAHPLPPRRRAV